MANDNTTRTAPYVAFKSFCSAIQGLRIHGLPPTLNRTAWENRSGAEQSQILGALTFLGLINDKGETQESLKQLVSLTEDSDQERKFYATLLPTRYDSVFRLDLQNETPKQLEDAIGEYGVSGKVKDRAVRFFLKAAIFAKIPLSSRLTANMRDMPASDHPATEGEATTPKPNGKVRRKRKQGGSPPPPGGQGDQIPPASGGSARIINLASGGTLTLSASLNFLSLNPTDRKFFSDLIDRLDQYEASVTTAASTGQ